MSFPKFITVVLVVNVFLVGGVSRVLTVSAAHAKGVEASWMPTLMTMFGAVLASAVVLAYVWASARSRREEL